MTPEQYERAARIFEEAAGLPWAERADHVRAACDGDDVVRARVEAMLVQDDAPAIDLEAAPEIAALRREAAAPARIPERIGRYRVIGVLGTGGMGVVYRAEQDRPRRAVALKVLRPSMLASGTGAALRRFEHEAELLGRLSHPGIGQIFEAGSWDAGDGPQPFLAMELIDGHPLLEFAREHRLGVRERLALLARICDAVQHAHLSGVVHRDLKPANILVTGNGDPKILDFGIARAIGADARATTLRTQVGHLLGTIGYMSPEQASGTTDVDARCDVYALGVILFELLTGRLPHELTGRSLTDAVRIVGHTDPVRLRTIDPALRGDVETIVATAVERDRGRRYQSAGALADDIRAHLEHRPIRARPAGPVLRTRKWARRHPAATTAIVIGLLAAAAVAGVYAERTASARTERLALAAATVDEAAALAKAYEEEREAATAREHEYDTEISFQLTRYNTPAELAALEGQERDYLRLRRRRENDYYRALELLTRAERQGADATRCRRVRGGLYASRYREAVSHRDRFERERYLDLVRANDDADGRLEAALARRGNVSFRSDPSGAEVHVFRMREKTEVVADGEPRLVPVPLDPAAAVWPVPPGTWALRVVAGAGPLAAGDVIFEVAGRPIREVVLVAEGRGPVARLDRLVSVDGEPVRGDWEIDRLREPAAAARRFAFERDGETFAVEGTDLAALGVAAVEPGALVERGDVPVRAWTGGRAVDMIAPRGLVVRTTAAPIFLGEGTIAGTTPFDLTGIETGEYLAVLRRDGCEDARVPVRVIDDKNLTNRSWLPPAGATPPGYRLVQSVTPELVAPFWMQEHEVTAGEYFEFLNDPATRREIDASEIPIRVPRSAGIVQAVRDGNGLYVLPAGWDERWPIFGVSWDDAKAYARWRTARAAAASGSTGAGLTFDLPTQAEQQAAWVNEADKPYPFGWTFRPAWVSSNYARPSPSPEPVMRFPIDASVFGVFDLCGSVSEWLDEWWVESAGTRRYVGGSWGHGGIRQQSEMFTVYGYNGAPPQGTMETVGFRLVARTE